MRIFLNDHKVASQNDLLLDESVAGVGDSWGKTQIYSRSAIDLRNFRTPFGSISLLYGPRQVGKTSSLRLFLASLPDSETLLFTDCSAVLNRSDLFQHLRGLIEGPTTIVLDEVQEVPDWHLALRALHAEGLLRQCRVWCTGSEARHLLESGERLPGRKGEGTTLFARPWSFREYLEFFFPAMLSQLEGMRLSYVTQEWIDDRDDAFLAPWRGYLTCGGIPKVAAEFKRTGTISDRTFRIYEDWILGTWSEVRTAERSLRALARRLTETMNSRVSFEALKKDTDILSANTVRTLLELQEDHFALRVVPRFDPQRKRFLPAKLKKVFPLDPFIARTLACIGANVRRKYAESCPPLALDECAFQTQTLRLADQEELTYLYSDHTKSEVDFCLGDFAFELKTRGRPTEKQRALLQTARRPFVLQERAVPIVACLLGESRVP